MCETEGKNREAIIGLLQQPVDGSALKLRQQQQLWFQFPPPPPPQPPADVKVPAPVVNKPNHRPSASLDLRQHVVNGAVAVHQQNPVVLKLIENKDEQKHFSQLLNKLSEIFRTGYSIQAHTMNKQFVEQHYAITRYGVERIAEPSYQDPSVIHFQFATEEQLETLVSAYKEAIKKEKITMVPHPEMFNVKSYLGQVKKNELTDELNLSRSFVKNDEKTVLLAEESKAAEGHNKQRVRVLNVDPDGRVISASDGDAPDALKIWRLAKDYTQLNRQPCKQYQMNECNAAVILPDGRLASGRGRTITIQNIEGEPQQSVTLEIKSTVYALVVANGKLISGSAEQNCPIKLWDVDKRAAKSFGQSQGGVNALGIMPGGELVSIHSTGGLCLWDIERSEQPLVTLKDEHVDHFSILKDGRLVTGSAEKGLKIWKLKRTEKSSKLELQNTFPQICTRQSGIHMLECLLVLPNDRVVIGGSIMRKTQKGVLQLRDLNTGTVLSQTEMVSPFSALALLPNGQLMCGHNNGMFTFWHVGLRALRLAEIKPLLNEINPETTIATVNLQNAIISDADIWDIRANLPVSIRLKHGRFAELMEIVGQAKKDSRLVKADYVYPLSVVECLLRSYKQLDVSIVDEKQSSGHYKCYSRIEKISFEQLKTNTNAFFMVNTAETDEHEAGASYIFVVRVPNGVLLIDPLGSEIYQPGLQRLLKNILATGYFNNIYVSQAAITQAIKDDPHGVNASGPICVELMNHFLEWHKHAGNALGQQILAQLKPMSSIKSPSSAVASRFYVDLQSNQFLLPDLLKTASGEKYAVRTQEIRQKHLLRLEMFLHNLGKRRSLNRPSPSSKSGDQKAMQIPIYSLCARLFCQIREYEDCLRDRLKIIENLNKLNSHKSKLTALGEHEVTYQIEMGKLTAAEEKILSMEEEIYKKIQEVNIKDVNEWTGAEYIRDGKQGMAEPLLKSLIMHRQFFKSIFSRVDFDEKNPPVALDITKIIEGKTVWHIAIEEALQNGYLHSPLSSLLSILDAKGLNTGANCKQDIQTTIINAIALLLKPNSKRKTALEFCCQEDKLHLSRQLEIIKELVKFIRYAFRLPGHYKTGDLKKFFEQIPLELERLKTTVKTLELQTAAALTEKLREPAADDAQYQKVEQVWKKHLHQLRIEAALLSGDKDMKEEKLVLEKSISAESAKQQLHKIARMVNIYKEMQGKLVECSNTMVYPQGVFFNQYLKQENTRILLDKYLELRVAAKKLKIEIVDTIKGIKEPPLKDWSDASFSDVEELLKDTEFLDVLIEQRDSGKPRPASSPQGAGVPELQLADCKEKIVAIGVQIESIKTQQQLAGSSADVLAKQQAEISLHQQHLQQLAAEVGRIHKDKDEKNVQLSNLDKELSAVKDAKVAKDINAIKLLQKARKELVDSIRVGEDRIAALDEEVTETEVQRDQAVANFNKLQTVAQAQLPVASSLNETLNGTMLVVGETLRYHQDCAERDIASVAEIKSTIDRLVDLHNRQSSGAMSTALTVNQEKASFFETILVAMLNINITTGAKVLPLIMGYLANEFISLPEISYSAAVPRPLAASLGRFGIYTAVDEKGMVAVMATENAAATAAASSPPPQPTAQPK